MKKIDLVLILAYFLLMAVCGVIAWHRNKTSEDYFVAGKKLGTFSIAAMWLASWVGGATITGTAANVYNYGISGGWYVVFLALGTFLFGISFAGIAKRLGDKLKNITYPALITSRYDKKTGGLTVLCCFLAGLGFLAGQFVAMASILTTLTDWSQSTCFWVSVAVTVAYSSVGGLMAITYTNWIQVFLIILGTVILGIPISAKAIGGVSAFATLPAAHFDIGGYGWSRLLALAVSSVFSFFTSAECYTRCFAAKSLKVSRNGAIWASLGVLTIAIATTFIGMSARVLIPSLESGMDPYTALVVNYFPAGVTGLVLIGVFAAIMSTAVVFINTCSANISIDMYKAFINPRASDKTLRRLGIAASLFVGLVGAAFAWWKYDIIELMLLAFTLQSATLFFPTVCGVAWKKPTARAAFLSIAVSLAVVALWLVAGNVTEIALFKIDALWPGLLASAIVFFPAALYCKPTENDLKSQAMFF